MVTDYPKKVTVSINKEEAEFLHRLFGHQPDYSLGKAIKWHLEMARNGIFMEAAEMKRVHFELSLISGTLRVMYALRKFEFRVFLGATYPDGFQLRLERVDGVELPFAAVNYALIDDCISDFRFYYRQKLEE